MKQDITVEEKLCHFMEEYACDRCSLELLHFLTRHPKTRFSRSAINHYSAWSKSDIERALRHLGEVQLVTTYSENGTTFYSLTQNESLCKSVLDLLSIEWVQWQRLLKQAYAVSPEVRNYLDTYPRGQTSLNTCRRVVTVPQETTATRLHEAFATT